MLLYCPVCARATDVSAAIMTGIDRYGFDMSVNTAEGRRPVRVAFATQVSTPDEARAALITMAKEARLKLS
jgi:hypothetical protein